MRKFNTRRFKTSPWKYNCKGYKTIKEFWDFSILVFHKSLFERCLLNNEIALIRENSIIKYDS